MKNTNTLGTAIGASFVTAVLITGWGLYTNSSNAEAASFKLLQATTDAAVITACSGKLESCGAEFVVSNDDPNGMAPANNGQSPQQRIYVVSHGHVYEEGSIGSDKADEVLLEKACTGQTRDENDRSLSCKVYPDGIPAATPKAD